MVNPCTTDIKIRTTKVRVRYRAQVLIRGRNSSSLATAPAKVQAEPPSLLSNSLTTRLSSTLAIALCRVSKMLISIINIPATLLVISIIFKTNGQPTCLISIIDRAILHEIRLIRIMSKIKVMLINEPTMTSSLNETLVNF